MCCHLQKFVALFARHPTQKPLQANRLELKQRTASSLIGRNKKENFCKDRKKWTYNIDVKISTTIFRVYRRV
jgi:hypothetical protein